MLRRMLLGKIHGATVTHADVAYEGSVSIPPELLAAAGLLVGEAVSVWNVTNGNRLETYTIAGEAGSGVISINGAAAHLVSPGDKVIIAAFGFFLDPEAVAYAPKVVFVDDSNRIKACRPEVAGPGVPISP
jgi:aspartate 1-decarboxylase